MSLFAASFDAHSAMSADDWEAQQSNFLIKMKGTLYTLTEGIGLEECEIQITGAYKTTLGELALAAVSWLRVTRLKTGENGVVTTVPMAHTMAGGFTDLYGHFDKDPRLLDVLLEYIRGVCNADSRFDAPRGFFKEFALPTPYHIMDAEAALEHAKMHLGWTTKNSELYSGYYSFVKTFSTAPGIAHEPFMHDPNYRESDEVRFWDASVHRKRAQNVVNEAIAHLERVKEQHDRQLEHEADNHERQLAIQERQAKKRKIRDDIYAHKEHKLTGTGVLYKFIAGGFEGDVAKFIAVDDEDETSVIVKKTTGDGKGGILSVPLDNLIVYELAPENWL